MNYSKKHPEKRIENWLKKNLHLFEEGMQFIKQQFYYVYLNRQDFTKHIRIDILAKDKLGMYVIIEVKKTATIYAIDLQLKHYMEKFPYPCRGILATFSNPYKLLNRKLPSNITIWNIKEKYHEVYPHKKSP